MTIFRTSLSGSRMFSFDHISEMDTPSPYSSDEMRCSSVEELSGPEVDDESISDFGPPPKLMPLPEQQTISKKEEEVAEPSAELVPPSFVPVLLNTESWRSFIPEIRPKGRTSSRKRVISQVKGKIAKPSQVEKKAITDKQHADAKEQASRVPPSFVPVLFNTENLIQMPERVVHNVSKRQQVKKQKPHNVKPKTEDRNVSNVSKALLLFATTTKEQTSILAECCLSLSAFENYKKFTQIYLETLNVEEAHKVLIHTSKFIALHLVKFFGETAGFRTNFLKRMKEKP